MFEPLSKTHIRGIVDLILNSLRKRLEDKQLKLEVTEKAKDAIIEQGYDVAFGARPLKRFIQHEIETKVAKTILEKGVMPNITLEISESDGELVVNQKK